MATKSQIIDIAQELVQTRSFHGFSFQDIATAVGVRKASLYHYFASKDELAIAVLRRYREAFKAWTREISGAPYATQLERFCQLYGEHLGAGERVCPGGAFVPSWRRLSQSVRAEVEALLADQKAWLESVLRGGVNAGTIRCDSGDPAAQTACVISTVQGALLYARVTADRRDFQDAIDTMLSAMLVRHEA